MIDFIVFNAVGAIIRIGTCQQHLLLAQILSPTEFVMEGTARLTLDYINTGVVTARPSQSTTLNKLTLNADGIDEIIISNAPIGATCTFKNSETISGLIDGTDNFRTTIEGVYTMTISLWPYLVHTAVINAV